MASTKRKRPPSRDVDDDNTDEWDIKHWTSRHYDDDADDISEDTTSAIEKDLFDPSEDNTPKHTTNERKTKSGGGGRGKMINEDGMFLSLEVLPANTYTVERTGDEVVGYVTRVIIHETGRGEQGEDDNAADTITIDNAHANNLDNNDDDNNNDDADMAKRKEKAKRKREKVKLNKMESCNNNKDDGGGEEKKATKIAAIKSTSKEKSDGNTSSSSGREQDESINTSMTKKERRRMKREAKKLLLVNKLQDKGQQQHDEDHTRRTRRQKTNNESSTPSTKNLRQNHDDDDDDDDDIDDDGVNNEVEQLRTSWSIAAPGISLHPILSKGLHQLNYAHPTPIQCATLPPAILGRRDIVGAAPTGSGKTLSYGLPILQRLLDERDEYNEQQQQEQQERCTMKEVDETYANNRNGKIISNNDSNRVLRALILVPTRELAIQVEAELLKVCLKYIGIRTIVGGFAEAKQRRVLEKERPAIVVATPGRLWELVRIIISLFFYIHHFLYSLGSRAKKEMWGREERRMHQ
jgi:ATP-dependent RNA helicase DDX24/MAK5